MVSTVQTVNTGFDQLPSFMAPNELLSSKLFGKPDVVLTSRFKTENRPNHKGIDFGAPTGTPVHSVAGGIATQKNDPGGWGNYVEIKHDDGSITRYAHLSRSLAQGRIESGQLIGEVGSTGRSTGPHLHFEYLPDGQNQVDPLGSNALAFYSGNPSNPNAPSVASSSTGSSSSSSSSSGQNASLLASLPEAAAQLRQPEIGTGSASQPRLANSSGVGESVNTTA